MSYILDALKRSEEERKKLQKQNDSPVSLSTGPGARGKRNRLVPALIVSFCIFLSVAIFGVGWWFVHLQKADEKPISPSHDRIEKTEHEETAGKDQIEEISVVEPELPPEEKTPDMTDSPSEADVSPSRSATVEIDEIPTLAELPFSLKSMLPEMKFRGHVYSPTPEQRMIMIDASVAREGDLVAPELILKEITKDGLIMSFRGNDFRIELF